MKKELELFRPQKHTILSYIRTRGIDKVSTYSATTLIPLLVIYTFIVEDIEEHREFAELRIVELKQFYNLE